MTKPTTEFNAAEAEGVLVQQMSSAYSASELQKALETARNEGVLVPSVRDPKDGTGYDIFSLLLKERIVMVQGQVEPAMAGVIIAQLKYLEQADPDKEIKMIINSPGGSVIDGFAIIDVMENLQNEITTIGIGLQASMGSHILAAGDHRMMAEKANLMIHGAATRQEGKVTKLHNDLNFSDRLVEEGFANYIRHVGLTADFWSLCDDESWFTAKQAKEIGFIHEIMPVSEISKSKLIAAGSAEKYLEGQAKQREAKVPTDEKDMIITLLNAKPGQEIRPEILVALSKIEKYWTPELKALKQSAPTAAVNDNTSGISGPAKKQSNGGPGLN